MGRGYKSSRSSAHTRDSIRSKPRAPPDFNPADAKIPAINSYEDVADEVDDFHLQRDKVLLDNGGDRTGRTRRGRDMDEESEVEEVYGLGTDEDDEEDEDDEDLEEYASTNEEDEDDDGKFTKRARGASNLSDDDDEEDRDDEEEDVEGWGTSKSAYYGGNEADITTEQDAFDEEAEARRIQKKQLASMTAEDFMLDLDEWSTTATKSGSTITTKKATTITKTTETLPTAIPSDLSSAARLSLLKSRNPEFELLSAEFLELQKIYPVLVAQAEHGGEVNQVRYKALAAYLGVLAMYFALLSRDQTGSWTGVKEHGIMDGLVRCRELWEKVKGLEEEQREESEDEQVNGVGKDIDMVDGELDSVDEYDEEEEETEDISPEPKPVRRQLVVSNGKPTAPRKRAKLDLALDTPPTTTKIPSKFSHPIPTTATDLSDLAALIPTSKSKSMPTKKTSKPAISSSTKLNKNNDFTDPTTLSSADLSEKSSRKSSLRFHASQLLSKSALRAQAGRHTGGDTDLPRKDKHPERSVIVKRDQSLGDDLDLEEPTAEEKSLAKSINDTTDELDDDLDHYHLLASQSRKAKRIANSQNGEFTRFPTEEDVDGKRAIGYTIEKNKGLTPHRKKDVRNPRVKKRKAYEKANKKLRTVKKIYSGPSQGAYAGEMTGIKKGVIRSRKLK